MGFSSGARFQLWADNAVGMVTSRVQSLFGHTNFTQQQTLAETPGIDPRMIPRAPMANGDIDVHLLNELGRLGFKRGKLMTAQSHPEVMQAWNVLSHRAGMNHPPQLILVENNSLNAMTVTPEEVVVTTGLLKVLDLRELMAVLGHELGHGTSNHMKPRVIAHAAFGLLGAAGGYMASERANLTRWNRGSVLLASLIETTSMLVGAFFGSVVANQVSVRPTELEADRKGAAISGDPQALASALRKLDAHRGHGKVMGFLRHVYSGYPSIDERIERLEAMTPQPHQAVNLQAFTAQPVQTASLPRPQVSGIEMAERVNSAVSPDIAIN